MSRYGYSAVLFVLCLAVLGWVFVSVEKHSGAAKGSQTQGASLENQARYAEISTTSLQATSPIATSTRKLNLPILVYHIVRPSYASDSKAVRAIALTPETFDAEMSYLKTAGYHIVRFSDLEAYFKRGTPLPAKPIILSFDDGWSDQFIYAFPILKKHHYTATFFVFTNAIGRPGFLSWGDLQQLLAAQMTIGDHTRSHPYLTSIASSTVLWNEIYGSKQTLEKHLGVTINEFAYPFGQFNTAIVAMVKEAGYASARGDYFSGEQTASRLYDLSAINAPTTTALFEKRFPSP